MAWSGQINGHRQDLEGLVMLAVFSLGSNFPFSDPKREGTSQEGQTWR